MSRYSSNYFTKEEDELILRLLRECETDAGPYSGPYGLVRKRCQMISKNIMPHRDHEAIRHRWYKLVNERPEPEIKNLTDLLSPKQRRRIRVRLPTLPTNYIDPRTGRKAT